MIERSCAKNQGIEKHARMRRFVRPVGDNSHAVSPTAFCGEFSGNSASAVQQLLSSFALTLQDTGACQDLQRAANIHSFQRCGDVRFHYSLVLWSVAGTPARLTLELQAKPGSVKPNA